jgi:hypothetical protein
MIRYWQRMAPAARRCMLDPEARKEPPVTVFLTITIAVFVLAALVDYVVALRAGTFVDAAAVRVRLQRRGRS